MKMEEWKEYRLGDIGRIITGKTPSTACKTNYGGKTPFLTPSDDLSVKHTYKTIKTLSEQGVSSVINCLIPAESICVSCIGSDLGKVTIINTPAVTNQQINSIVVNKDKFDIDFVYYSMKIIGRLMNYHSKTSTAVPIINKTQFSNYKIKIPSLPTQQKIAAILSSLDDKIELNNKININLEQQAQALFKNWISEHASSIKMRPLFELVEINPDTYSPKNKWEYVNYLDTSSITNGVMSGIQMIKPDVDKLPSRARRIIKQNDIVYSTVRPNQLHFGIIQTPVNNMLASTGFAVIRSKFSYISSPYLYHFLIDHDFIERMQQLAEQSTSTFPSVKPSDIGTCLIPCAEIEQMQNISEKINGMYMLISSNQQENRVLSSLRDTLLPKLMNEEIEV